MLFDNTSKTSVEIEKKLLISVVICTYNRANLLFECLKTVADQRVDESLYEVLVVNNNSTDMTQEIASSFIAKHSNFRLVTETRQGLSHARNRGYIEARGEYVAYVDDDARAASDWISRIISFTERHPEVGAFGGPYEAFSLSQLPYWFPPEYGSWSLGEEERPVRIGAEWINGTNMIFRKDILEQRRGFNPALGMKGGLISYGEETRLLLDLKKASVEVYYVPDAKVFHLIAEYKMSLFWLLRSCYESGKCSAETFNNSRSLFSLAISLAASVVKGFITFFAPKRIPLKRRIYYAFSGLSIELGAAADNFKRTLGTD